MGWGGRTPPLDGFGGSHAPPPGWAATPFLFSILFYFLNKFLSLNIYIFFLLRSTLVAILLLLAWRLTKSVKFFNKILLQEGIYKLGQPQGSVN
jgi:hypothetical protein